MWRYSYQLNDEEIGLIINFLHQVQDPNEKLLELVNRLQHQRGTWRSREEERKNYNAKYFVGI